MSPNQKPYTKAELERFLRQDPFLHLYTLGDLDDFFWPHTRWYVRRRDGELEAVLLLYTAETPPVLLALADPLAPLQPLLLETLPELPGRFYSHLSPGIEETLSPTHRLESHGAHHKMALLDPAAVWGVETGRAVRLSPADLPAIAGLYAASYPGNWFDSRMLETGQYFGVWENGELLSIAGIHVYSPAYGVAALGNITTHPAHRKQGLGKIVTARLCQSLLESVDHIGLNVKVDNHTAVGLYQQLGFQTVADYGEYMIERR